MNLCILFILDFKPSFSNRAETELKCNTGIWENLSLAFYHIQTVPFSSNIYCDDPNKVCLCYGYRITNCKVYHSMISLFFVTSGTQQENSYMKHAFRKRLPLTTMLGRVNEASHCVWSNFCMNEMQSTTKSLLRVSCLALKKKNKFLKIYRVPRNCYS